MRRVATGEIRGRLNGGTHQSDRRGSRAQRAQPL